MSTETAKKIVLLFGNTADLVMFFFMLFLAIMLSKELFQNKEVVVVIKKIFIAGVVLITAIIVFLHLLIIWDLQYGNPVIKKLEFRPGMEYMTNDYVSALYLLPWSVMVWLLTTLLINKVILLLRKWIH